MFRALNNGRSPVNVRLQFDRPNDWLTGHSCPVKTDQNRFLISAFVELQSCQILWNLSELCGFREGLVLTSMTAYRLHGMSGYTCLTPFPATNLRDIVCIDNLVACKSLLNRFCTKRLCIIFFYSMLRTWPCTCYPVMTEMRYNMRMSKWRPSRWSVVAIINGSTISRI